MTRDEVFRLYKREAARVLDVDEYEIRENARFVEDLGADSLAVIEILVFVEEDLNIGVPQQLFNDVRTVGQAVDLVHAHC